MAGEANVNAVVTVRLASVDDADAIGRIQVETWRAAYTGLMPDETIAASTSRRDSGCGGRGSNSRRPGSASSSPRTTVRWSASRTSGPCREERGAGELYAIYVQPVVAGAPGPAAP